MNELFYRGNDAVIEPNGSSQLVWAVAGTLAGAAATLLLGWLRIRRDDRAIVLKGHEGLSRSQRQMIESLRSHVQQLEVQRDIDRKFYEAKIEDIRHGYQEAMKEQTRLSYERIRRLEVLANIEPGEDTQ